jgi:hypothetical protein
MNKVSYHQTTISLRASKPTSITHLIKIKISMNSHKEPPRASHSQSERYDHNIQQREQEIRRGQNNKKKEHNYGMG